MMNERIRALLEKSTKQINPDDREWVSSKVDQEKFAELIVRECAQVANDSNQSKNRAVGVSVGDVIRKHFGVGE